MMTAGFRILLGDFTGCSVCSSCTFNMCKPGALDIQETSTSSASRPLLPARCATRRCELPHNKLTHLMGQVCSRMWTTAWSRRQPQQKRWPHTSTAHTARSGTTSMQMLQYSLPTELHTSPAVSEACRLEAVRRHVHKRLPSHGCQSGLPHDCSSWRPQRQDADCRNRGFMTAVVEALEDIHV